jgi:dihydroneopterin aldolase
VSDQIVLRGLRARGHHGVYAEEREAGQTFLVDVVLHVDARQAAKSDDVADTVHYGELAAEVVAIVEGEPVNLLETLADRIANRWVCPSKMSQSQSCVTTDERPASRVVARQQPWRPVGDVAGRARRSRRRR